MVSPLPVGNAFTNSKFDFFLNEFLSVAVVPRIADGATGGATAEVLGFVFPFRPQISVPTAKFLPDPTVPVPGACEMYLNRILDSHPRPPSATWFRLFLEQDMVNTLMDGHRCTHRTRTFRREVRQSHRVSVDWSDPYVVRSPSPWSSEFDSSDSEIQWSDQHW